MVEPSLGRWLDEEARRLGVSRSEVLNRMLAQARERALGERVEALVYAGLGTVSLVLILVFAPFLG
jgi:hypothetical protein